MLCYETTVFNPCPYKIKPAPRTPIVSHTEASAKMFQEKTGTDTLPAAPLWVEEEPLPEPLLDPEPEPEPEGGVAVAPVVGLTLA